MKKNKVLVTESENLSEETKKKIRKLGKTDFLNLDYESLKKVIASYNIIIIGLSIKIDVQIINQARKLEFILSPTTGLNHLNINYLQKKKIKVISLKAKTSFLKNIPATAEHTFALILNLVRKISLANNDVKRKNWNRKKFLGSELFDKNLGIVGYGRIGRIVKKIGNAFGMKTYFYDPYVKASFKNSTKVKSLQELAKISDIFTIHIPSNEKNKKIISKKVLINLKKNSFLINTSRGDLIDEHALIEILKNKKIAGAALDVINFEYGNVINQNIINYACENDNLLITPHIGGYTNESINKTHQHVVEILLDQINAPKY